MFLLALNWNSNRVRNGGVTMPIERLNRAFGVVFCVLTKRPPELEFRCSGSLNSLLNFSLINQFD